MKRIAAVGLFLLALAAPAVPAAADTSSGTSSPATSPVNLLAQTPWVQSRGDYQLRVSFDGLQPADQVQVVVYDKLVTRTDFQLAAKGNVQEYSFYRQRVPVAALTPDPGGGYDIDLPVNQAAAAGAPFPEVLIQGEQNGVQAVQVQLLGALGGPKGAPLTTFLTFSEGTVKSQGYAPLAAAVVVPYRSEPVVGPDGRLGAPPATEAARLDQLAVALNKDVTVPASLLASPVTLAALRAGAQQAATDRDAVGNLAGGPAGQLVQVLPTTWSPVAVGDLASAGLSSEIGAQLDQADQTLRATLGATPATTTWVVDGPLDQFGLQAITARGATQLIVPDSDLAPLSEEITTTFTHANQLGASGVTVYGADAELSSDFTRAVPPVLGANILLADMAMIFTEAPGDQYARGVVALPPSGSTVDPTFVDTLLSGMAADPLLNPVTASGLFSTAGVTRGPRSLAAPDAGLTSGAAALRDAKPSITAARANIAELASVLPAQAAQLSTLGSQLLLAESETLSGPQRSAVLNAINQATNVVNNAVTLPPPTSITLTSTQGQIPITILSGANLHPRVELRLSSSRLIFVAFKPPDGTCTIPEPAEEDCVLSLKTQNTTLKVPVETRSSGVFPLDVSLTPPGALFPVFSRDRDTVRSTAVSKVAIVLIVLALGGLAFWWVRDIRRGRRPKGMVPTPGGPDPDPPGPDFDDFFRRPPPTYRGGLMSPSGLAAGPSAATDRYGSGRETRE